MRIVTLWMCAVVGACHGKDKPPAPAPAPTPTPGSAAVAADKATAEVTPSAGVPAKLDKPLAISRKHAAGQKYKLHMDRVSVEFGVTTFDATATVTEAAGPHVKFQLDVDKIAPKDAPAVEGAKFAIDGDFGDRPHVDAEQTDSASAELYLTPIEHLMGDLCTPPKTAHMPGDTWTENTTEWKFSAFSSVGNELRATFDGKSKDGWQFALSLATTDGFTGTCTVMTGDTTWKLAVVRE